MPVGSEHGASRPSSARRTRVLLIDCSRPLDPRDRLIYDTHHPPLGLLCLATYLNASDLADRLVIRLLDSTIDYESFDDLCAMIRDFSPDIIGLRCLYYHTAQFHAITAFAKTLSKPPVTVGGGPYASAAAEQALRTDEYLDFIVVGEGEEVFYDVVSAVHYDRSPKGIPGLCWREGNQGRCGPPRELIHDLDKLPVTDWTLIDLSRYDAVQGQAPILRPQAPVLTSRGCPYRCTYCHELFKKRFRVRSAEHVVRELEILDSLGVRDISIIDDIFNLYPSRVIELFELISQRNLKLQIYYPNGLRGDRITEEVVDAMVDGGSILFSYALESGSERIQKSMKKRLQLEPFERAVHYTIDKGVMVDMFLMVGFPSETFEEASATIDFLKRFDVVCMPYLNVVNVFPGTEMFKDLVEDLSSSGQSAQLLVEGYLMNGFNPIEVPNLKAFTLTKTDLQLIRTKLLAEYVLKRDRLDKALEIQRRFLTEDEITGKYKTYFPGIESIEQLRGVTVP